MSWHKFLIFLFFFNARHSVEECRNEMKSMDTHMNKREAEKTVLELEVTRLQGEILIENW